MNDPIRIVIPGVPVAKGRPRVTRQGRAYTPAKTMAWEQMAAWEAAAQMQGRRMLEGPVQVSIVASWPIPVSWPQWRKRAALQGRVAHTRKPDGDNVAKAVLDALQDVVFGDDSGVVRLQVTKCWDQTGQVLVDVSEIDMLMPDATRAEAAA